MSCPDAADHGEGCILHLGIAVGFVVPEADVQPTIDEVGNNAHLGFGGVFVVIRIHRREDDMVLEREARIGVVLTLSSPFLRVADALRSRKYRSAKMRMFLMTNW